MLRIHLFGPLQVFENDKLLPPLTPSKISSLLAYLLLRREYPIPREQVAFTLWPDTPEGVALSNLRRHLHLLRRSLPSMLPTQSWVNADHDTIQWNRDTNYWLDLQKFEHLTKQVQSTELSNNQQEGITLLQSAVDIYTGDLLEGFYEDWVLTERERLREQYAVLLERLAALQESTGEFRSAIATTKRLLTCDPFREDVHRHLMELHYWVGDRAAALRQYEDCKKLLWEKLTVEPMAETRNLSEAITNSQIIPRKNFPPPLPVPIIQAPILDTPPVREPLPTIQGLGRQFPKKPLLAQKKPFTWFTIVLLSFFTVLISFRMFIDFVTPVETITFSGSSVVQDTWLTPEFPNSVFDPAFPETLFKDYNQVHMQYYGTDTDRFVIRFDLGAMTSITQAESATLFVHFETWTSNTGQNALQRAYPARVAVYRITQPWQIEYVTFNVPWSEPGLSSGVDYDPKPLDSQFINDTGWLAFDITLAVQSWLVQPDENRGVMLKITDAPEGVAHYWLDTSEYPDPERRPRLMLTYREK